MLNPDYRDILSAFIDAKVDFLLVGAYALAFHGLPRATGDIDLWIRRSEDNALRVMSALTAFGAPLFQVTPDDFVTPDMVFQIGLAPRRIDILTSIDGVEFEDAWPDRALIELEGLSIPIISKAYLIQNKESTGRPKDKIDADWLHEKDKNSE